MKKKQIHIGAKYKQKKHLWVVNKLGTHIKCRNIDKPFNRTLIIKTIKVWFKKNILITVTIIYR